ncbi:hypothetical protein D918_03029 [Trichuris suis]|nr:hypothetical protein D918_03029 [Trichuris suis]
MKFLLGFSKFLWLFVLCDLSFSDDEFPMFNVTPPAQVQIPSVRMRAWNLDYFNYVGTLWKSPCYWDECDGAFSDHNFNPAFNKVDGKVDRRRAKTKCGIPTYLVRSGLPLNPEGRTGYSGRGVLPRWGPNHLVKILLIWKQRGARFTIWRNGPDNFLSGFVDDLSSGYPKSIRDDFDEILRRANISEPERKKLLHKSEKTLKKVISGSMPHSWNTDNAWVEYHYYFLPCQKNEKLCNLLLAPTNKKYKWIHELSLHTFKQMKAQMKEAMKPKLYPEQYSAFCKRKPLFLRWFARSKI